MSEMQTAQGCPPASPEGAGTAKGQEFVNRFGLPTATALVVGSIIGTGVFALPSALAPYGPSSLLAFGLVTVGALALAVVFGWLNKRVPGLETASVAAGRVRKPQRNVSRATIYGTLACAFIYILGTMTVFGTVAHKTLLTSTAPFSDSANAIFAGSWAGQVMAVAAIISGIGCLNGWTLICAEMPMAAARDRLFPRQFAQVSKREIPVFGILAATILASVLTVFGYTHFQTVFTDMLLLSVLTAVIPYLYSAAAHLYWLLVKGREVSWPHLTRDLVVTVLALVFSFWALAGTGYQAVYYGIIAFFLGVPVYIWMKAQRKEYGESPVIPIDYPAGRPFAAAAAPGSGAGADSGPGSAAPRETGSRQLHSQGARS